MPLGMTMLLKMKQSNKNPVPGIKNIFELLVRKVQEIP